MTSVAAERMIIGMLRRMVACAAVISVAIAAVVDSPAICDDRLAAAGSPGQRGDVPPAPTGSCAGMPCQTPGETPLPAVLAFPVMATGEVVLREVELVSADVLPPPTPPPTCAPQVS